MECNSVWETAISAIETYNMLQIMKFWTNLQYATNYVILKKRTICYKLYYNLVKNSIKVLVLVILITDNLRSALLKC